MSFQRGCASAQIYYLRFSWIWQEKGLCFDKITTQTTRSDCKNYLKFKVDSDLLKFLDWLFQSLDVNPIIL